MSPWPVAPVRSPELMDDPGLATEDHFQALSALARINALSRTAAHLAEAVHSMVAATAGPPTPIQIVDVACGGGDVTLDLARRLGSRFRVTGIDMSERAVERARSLATSRGIPTVGFEVRDVVATGFPPCDIAVSSLFFHHLDDTCARDTLRGLAVAARLGIIVSDLVRSRSGLLLAILGTRLLTTSHVARIDGPLSVRAARTLAEHRTLCLDAGLVGCRVRRVWPERVLIEWSRPRGET